MNASDIARFLNLPLEGGDLSITGPCSLSNPRDGGVTFCSQFNDDSLAMIGKARMMVIAQSKFEGRLSCPHVLTPHPRREYAQVLEHFFSMRSEPILAETAKISRTASLGIGAGVGEYAVIGDNVSIGDGTVIHNHVVIVENTVIGRDCVIGSHSVIGEAGFGFVFENDAPIVRMPQIGSVRIGDHVEIGAHCSIACATLDTTTINDLVKIDDHVYIAHNCNIGARSIITAGAMIAGSVTVGKNVWIGVNATVTNDVSIGEHALLGIGAVVINDVPGHAVMAGNPARKIRDRAPGEP